jgi:hypothetical protein
MVHALQRAGSRLRPGGMLLSIRPHRTWRPLVAIRTPQRRTPITHLLNPAFDRYLAAAESALDRVVSEGSFTLAGTAPARYRIRLDNLSQLRTYLELINPPRPRFPPGSRAHLAALWQSAPRGARIEVTESLTLTALRRRDR